MIKGCFIHQHFYGHLWTHTQCKNNIFSQSWLPMRYTFYQQHICTFLNIIIIQCFLYHRQSRQRKLAKTLHPGYPIQLFKFQFVLMETKGWDYYLLKGGGHGTFFIHSFLLPIWNNVFANVKSFIFISHWCILYVP